MHRRTFLASSAATALVASLRAQLAGSWELLVREGTLSPGGNIRLLTPRTKPRYPLSLVVTGLLPTVGPWIEPVIAATIALGGYLAYRQKPARMAFMLVPLAFGLIHGLGFAAAAADKFQDISTADLGKLLLGFNVGVEAAQAGIIIVTAGVLFLLSKAGLAPTLLRRVLGLLIAAVGTAIMAYRIWVLAKGA
jgi:hypothetical protein